MDAEHTFYLTKQGESAWSTVPWVVGGLVLDCEVNLLCSDWDTVALDVLVGHLETDPIIMTHTSQPGLTDTVPSLVDDCSLSVVDFVLHSRCGDAVQGGESRLGGWSSVCESGGPSVLSGLVPCLVQSLVDIHITVTLVELTEHTEICLDPGTKVWDTVNVQVQSESILDQ